MEKLFIMLSLILTVFVLEYVNGASLGSFADNDLDQTGNYEQQLMRVKRDPVDLELSRQKRADDPQSDQELHRYKRMKR